MYICTNSVVLSHFTCYDILEISLCHNSKTPRNKFLLFQFQILERVISSLYKWPGPLFQFGVHFKRQSNLGVQSSMLHPSNQSRPAQMSKFLSLKFHIPMLTQFSKPYELNLVIPQLEFCNFQLKFHTASNNLFP